VLKVEINNALQIISPCSIFDSNFGVEAAAINIAYYNARFDTVTFKNNIGTAVQVSMMPYISDK